MDQIYKSLYEKQQKDEVAAETPMEENDDDDGKDERNPRPQPSTEQQAANTMEQILTEQESQHDEGEIKPAAPIPLPQPELVFNTPIPQQAQQKYNQKTAAAQAKGKKKLPSKK